MAALVRLSTCISNFATLSLFSRASSVHSLISLSLLSALCDATEAALEVADDRPAVLDFGVFLFQKQSIARLYVSRVNVSYCIELVLTVLVISNFVIN
jgi:hypothetical protein